MAKARLLRAADLPGCWSLQIYAPVPEILQSPETLTCLSVADGGHSHPIAPNRLKRDFAASRPNQVWLADLTYIHTDEGWLYLAAILDMATRKIVGPPGLVPLKSIPRIDLSGQARTASQGAMRETLHAEIALSALDMAIERQRPGSGLIHHSDRGIQYACEAYRQTLAAAEISPSMSGKGNCLEFKLVRAADQTIQRDRLKAQNAPMESFFHSLKVERVHTRRYATPAEARRDLFAYIEGFYNSRRLHSALGYITPSEAEEKAA